MVRRMCSKLAYGFPSVSPQRSALHPSQARSGNVNPLEETTLRLATASLPQSAPSRHLYYRASQSPIFGSMRPDGRAKYLRQDYAASRFQIEAAPDVAPLQYSLRQLEQAADRDTQRSIRRSSCSRRLTPGPHSRQPNRPHRQSTATCRELLNQAD